MSERVAYTLCETKGCGYHAPMVSGRMYCPRCGEKLRIYLLCGHWIEKPLGKFCRVCGVPVPESIYLKMTSIGVLG